MRRLLECLLGWSLLSSTSVNQKVSPCLLILRIDVCGLGEFSTKELSVWVVSDLATLQGRQMVLDAIQFLVRDWNYVCSYTWQMLFQIKSGLIRVTVLHNGPPSVLSRAIQAVISQQHPSDSVFAFLRALLSKSEESVDIPQVIDVANNCQLNSDKIVEHLFSSELNLTSAEQVLFARKVLKLDAGQNMLVCNGKVRC